MATENVGGVQYTVDADTAAMLKAEAVVNKSISKQVKDFDKADTAVRTFIATQEKLGRTVNSMGQVMNANGKIVANATTQYRTLANNAQSGFNTLNTQINGTAKAVRSARPDMQNMSYQLQDMAVQAQMGTSAFVIMAQQLPQMLVGMGAWAGAIGVAVTVLGLLATTTIDTTKDLEKIEKSVERVKAIMTVGAHGVTSYTEEMRKLGTLSQDIVKIKLANTLAEQENALRNMGGAAREAYEQALPFYNFTKGSSSSIFSGIIDDDDIEKLGAANPEITKARSGIEQLTQAVRLLESGGPKNLATGFDVMTSALGLLSNSAAQNTDKGRELIAALTSLSEEYTSSTIRAKALQDALDSGANSIEGNAEALQSFLKEMHLSNTLLAEGERAALKLRLEQDGLKDSEVAVALAAFDYNQKLVRQNELTEEGIEADKKRKKSLDDVSASLDAYFDKEVEDDRKKSGRETTNNLNFAQNIIESGKSPTERMQEQYARLDELRKTDLENAQVYTDAMIALDKKMAEDKVGFLSDAFSNLDTQIAGTMASVVLGAQTGEDALKSLATTILTQVIGAFVQWGVAEVAKLFTVESAEKGIQAANAAATTASVSAQVGMTSALAAQNAFAATAAIPAVGPILAPAAAAAAGAAAGAIGASAIPLAPLAGAREFGGPVTAGKSYLVGERGPEMVTMGASGMVTSNKDLMGASSGVSVNINNYSGQEVTQNYDEVKKIVTVEIGKQISGIRKGTSQMSKAMKGTMTTKGRATKV